MFPEAGGVLQFSMGAQLPVSPSSQTQSVGKTLIFPLVKSLDPCVKDCHSQYSCQNGAPSQPFAECCCVGREKSALFSLLFFARLGSTSSPFGLQARLRQCALPGCPPAVSPVHRRLRCALASHSSSRLWGSCVVSMLSIFHADGQHPSTADFSNNSLLSHFL